ncbi:Gram-negative bacterial tonB protein [Pigmentiphaga humi]|uniref:Gram-negative bacterial tonB protein n=1 Tax=Pigmentiphaga humi TaxID=2478468 RepID=A0A3P4B617_9BURK|nr:energy transducer TonB [Pigmentiphaga humi]VCU71739.1 Gram-negative bacterial tonB protein [Pigmentiphaga humi]
MTRLTAGLLLAGLLSLLPASNASALERKDLVFTQWPKVVYPHAAKRMGQEGTVIVHVVISSSGVPASVSVWQSSGFPLLDKAAVDAVGAARYRPFPDDVDQLVATHLPIRFSLNPRADESDSKAGLFVQACREFNDEIDAHRTTNPGASMEHTVRFQRTLNEMQALLQGEPHLSATAGLQSREERRRNYAAAFPGIFANAVERCRQDPVMTYGNAIVAATQEAGFLETDEGADAALKELSGHRQASPAL